MSSMLKVSEAFQRYRQSRQSGTLVHNMLGIFDSMSLYILASRDIDYNFDLLQQLSLIQKENTISQSPQEYQLAKEFRQFFKTYAEYMWVKNQSQTIAMSIVKSTQALIIEAKTSIYNFIWSLPGFRKALCRLDTTKDGREFTGMDYNIESIFAPILTAHTGGYTSNRKSSRAYRSLTEKMSQPEFDSVFEYLMKIVRANRAYTYDNVASFSDSLSTFELLGTVLILTVRLIKNNPEYIFVNGSTKIYQIHQIRQNHLNNIWDLINILYFTLFEIKKSTADSYRVNNDRLLQLTERLDRGMNQFLARQVDRTRKSVEEGKQGLERILTIVKEVDNSFVDSMIFANISHVLDQNDATTIYRLRRYLLERKIKPGTTLARSVCEVTNQILRSRIPPTLKSEYLRLLMAYNLCSEYVNIGNEIKSDESQTDNQQTDNPHLESLSTYLLTDARKLGDVTLIHALDVLDHFSRHLIVPNENCDISRDRCAKTIRLYLTYLKEATEIYEKMVTAFLEVPDQIKTQILSDMMAVAGYCKDLIMMLKYIGNEALEYIDPLLGLINKVINTKQLMNIPDSIDPAEIEVIDRVGPTYVEKFRPLLLDLLHHLSDQSIFIADDSTTTDSTDISDEWRVIYSMYHPRSDYLFPDSVFRMVMTSDSIQILRDVFHIDLMEEQIPHVILDSNTDDLDGLTDALTCDVLISPVAIPTGTFPTGTIPTGSNYVLVSHRTLHRILLERSNPFTREPLSFDDITELNSREDVKQDLDRVFDFIRKL